MTTATHIDELNAAKPASSDDPFVAGNRIDEYFQEIKTVLLNDFGSISGAVTATQDELNYVDIATLGTAAASKALVADGSGNINAAAITWTNLGTVTDVTLTAATVTTLDVSGTLELNAGTSINEFSTDDTLAGDSDDAVPTEQAVKGYVDARDTYYAMTYEIADVSTAETVYVPVPVTGTVVRMDTCLQGSITAADATITLVQSDDSAMASVTIAESGSAAGDVDTDDSITNASVTDGDYLKLATNGASTTAAKLLVSITIQTDII